MNVIKVISKSQTYEVGDFYGGDGENDVIRSMEIINHMLHIKTNHTHTLPIQFGDWVKFDDNTSMTFDEEE